MPLRRASPWLAFALCAAAAVLGGSVVVAVRQWGASLKFPRVVTALPAFPPPVPPWLPPPSAPDEQCEIVPDEPGAPERSCTCFRLCDQHDLRNFHTRLPNVTTCHSPWISYLSQIYKHGTIQLPVNLQEFGSFDLKWLPYAGPEACGKPMKPGCAACSRWLLDEAPTDQALRTHAEHWFNFPTFPMRRMIRMFRTHGSTDELRNRVAGPRWLEVARHRRDTWRIVCKGSGAGDDRGTAEGVDYGCWFSPMVGSGIFLELRHTLWVENRTALIEQLALKKNHDCLFAKAAAARGFDSIVIAFSLDDGRAEIIVTAGGCMTQKEPLPDACVPTSGARPFSLRSGWNASHDCECQPGSHMLNCKGEM